MNNYEYYTNRFNCYESYKTKITDCFNYHGRYHNWHIFMGHPVYNITLLIHSDTLFKNNNSNSQHRSRRRICTAETTFSPQIANARLL